MSLDYDIPMNENNIRTRVIRRLTFTTHMLAIKPEGEPCNYEVDYNNKRNMDVSAEKLINEFKVVFSDYYRMIVELLGHTEISFIWRRLPKINYDGMLDMHYLDYRVGVLPFYVEDVKFLSEVGERIERV